MDSILTVIDAADDQLLTSKDDVKTELGITDGSQDAWLDIAIARASAAIANYCSRIFITQQYSELWRPNREVRGALRLKNYPATVTDVTLNGTEQAETAYEIDGEAGLLYRLCGDKRAPWPCGKIVVEYDAGYDFEDLPADLSGASIELVKAGYFAKSRDPALRSENILEGLYSYTLFDPQNAEQAWPQTVVENLAAYRKRDR